MSDHDAPRQPETSITVHHHGSPHTFTLPISSTLDDLASAIFLSPDLQIPIENQKLLIAPKLGLQKPPFDSITPLADLLPLFSPKFKITLLGTKSQDIDSMNESIQSNKQRLAARTQARRQQHPPITRRPPGGIHTLSSPSSSAYTFGRCEPLPYLPNPQRSLTFLERLRDDPGIKFAMAKHRFFVPLLTEMNPAEHTTHESRTLGLNRNKGEVIELRLRTDAYDGYRDYRTIRKTLCHELAHCVHSEHDRKFWDLTKQIETEVESGDWTRGGHRLSEQEFYNPQDWETEGQRSDDEWVDHGGWTGGEFVLGRADSAAAGESGPALSRREIMARAAEDRLKREQQRGKGSNSNAEE
jgi:WLM domain